MGGVQGAVLAGGNSARMGRDKSRIIIGQGLTMAGNARRILSLSTGEDVLLSGPDGVRDLRRMRGPMGGMEAVLYATRFSAVLILPCDMPLVPVSLFNALLRSYRGNPGRPSVAVSYCLEPLLALIPASFAEKITNAIDAGHLKAGRFWIETGFTPVPCGSSSLLADIDHPGELSA